jgi:hypothetical protein
MSRIISVSRRTDVPAFYGAWFMRRMAEGLAGWENSFGGQRYHLVSLRREDVHAFVFWSKNFRPFLATLAEVRAAGYPILVNYTITGLPAERGSRRTRAAAITWWAGRSGRRTA